MPYFVAYQTQTKSQPRSNVANVILKNTHPIAWAANPPEVAKAVGQVTYLLFWEEISDEVAAMAGDWCSIETL